MVAMYMAEEVGEWWAVRWALRFAEVVDADIREFGHPAIEGRHLDDDVVLFFARSCRRDTFCWESSSLLRILGRRCREGARSGIHGKKTSKQASYLTLQQVNPLKVDLRDVQSQCKVQSAPKLYTGRICLTTSSSGASMTRTAQGGESTRKRPACTSI